MKYSMSKDLNKNVQVYFDLSVQFTGDYLEIGYFISTKSELLHGRVCFTWMDMADVNT